MMCVACQAFVHRYLQTGNMDSDYTEEFRHLKLSLDLVGFGEDVSLLHLLSVPSAVMWVWLALSLTCLVLLVFCCCGFAHEQFFSCAGSGEHLHLPGCCTAHGQHWDWSGWQWLRVHLPFTFVLHSSGGLTCLIGTMVSYNTWHPWEWLCVCTCIYKHQRCQEDLALVSQLWIVNQPCPCGRCFPWGPQEYFSYLTIHFEVHNPLNVDTWPLIKYWFLWKWYHSSPYSNWVFQCQTVFTSIPGISALCT